MATTSHTPSSATGFSPTRALLSLLLAAALVCSVGFGALPAWADTAAPASNQALLDTSSAPDSTAVPDTAVPAAGGASDITIFHTNDMHGYLQGNGAKVVGIDKVATLLKTTPDAILVDAGDATQGAPLASLTKGAAAIELMNAAGYSAMALGNHEFDYGIDQLLSNAANASFPFLSANTLKNGTPLMQGVAFKGGVNNGSNTIVEAGGKRIGFFGLTTTQTATSTNPSGVKDITFADEVATAQQQIDALGAENVDAIIALCHMGNGSAPCTGPDLAAALGGAYAGKLTALIDGHSHTEENTLINGTLVVQTKCNLAKVGKLTLSFAPGTAPTATETLLSAAALESTPGDPAVAAQLQRITEEQNALLSRVICTTPTTLWSGWLENGLPPSRLVETNFGNLAADAYRNTALDFMKTASLEAMPVVAIENGGSLREKVAAGPLTLGNLVTTFPYSNTVEMKTITPQILYQLLEKSLAHLQGQDAQTGLLLQTNTPGAAASGSFLQVAGFSLVANPNAVAGSRVTSVTLDGAAAPLSRTDNATKIALATNSFVMDGGDGYAELASLPLVAELGGELESVEAHLNALAGGGGTGAIPVAANGVNRIHFLGGYTPAAYTAKLAIVDEAGAPLAHQALSYAVDAGPRTNGTTDAHGILALTVADGPHAIRLGTTLTEIYVNNYLGVGVLEDATHGSYPKLTFLANGSCDPLIDPAPQPTPQPTPLPEAAPTPAPAAALAKTGDKTAAPAVALAMGALVSLALAAGALKLLRRPA
ncbi:MAG: bifunctional UDP-sugar hydrolase/5'-nucleotidase [Raoultibacter sp.]